MHADSYGAVSLSVSSLWSEILDTHILANTHTTDTIPSIRLRADTTRSVGKTGSTDIIQDTKTLKITSVPDKKKTMVLLQLFVGH